MIRQSVSGLPKKDRAQLQKNLERDLRISEDICPIKSRIRFEGRARSASPTLSGLAATKIIDPRGAGRGDLCWVSSPASYFRTISVKG
jgi:hypothetical protein